MRRQDFAKNATFVRFSPRPALAGALGRHVRKFFYEGSLNYYTTGTGRLESRDLQTTFRTELQNSDLIAVGYAKYYDLLETPFQIVTGVRLPVGTYDWQTALARYQLGSQRPFSGTAEVVTGTFYNGRQTGASFRGRVAVATRLSIEPNLSVTRTTLDEGRFTTKLISARVTSPITPRMFASVLLQYNSSTNAFGTNARFRWEYQPGSELFVVFTEGRSTVPRGFPDLDTRGFVVKINRLFRM
jgi:hypothetical protein